MKSHDLAQELLMLPDREVSYADGDDLLPINYAEDEDGEILIGCDEDEEDGEDSEDNVIEAEFTPIKRAS